MVTSQQISNCGNVNGGAGCAKRDALLRIGEISLGSGQAGEAWFEKRVQFGAMRFIAETGSAERQRGGERNAARAGQRGVQAIEIGLRELPNGFASFRLGVLQQSRKFARIDAAAENQFDGRASNGRIAEASDR